MGTREQIEWYLDEAENEFASGNMLNLVEKLASVVKLVTLLEDAYGLPDMRRYFCTQMCGDTKRPCACEEEADLR